MPDRNVSDTSEESDVKEKPKKRSRLKFIFILLFLLVLIVGTLGGAYWWFFLRSGSLGFSELLGGDKEITETEGQQSASKQNDNTKDAPLAPQPVLKPVTLPPFTVNLSDSSGKKYLRVGIDVELSTQDAIKILEAQGPRVRDAIILLLSSKTSADLVSAEGKVILKNEIADRLNQILGAPRVVRIYFTDFVIQ